MFGSKIALDKDLLRRCKLHAKTAGYSSVEEFIQHALESALQRANSASPEEEGQVRDRLKGLGYVE